ncbi:MAG: hypothetical protein ACRC67_28560 [Inquilinus sp.]|uniref:hypothetical protein n=1 Tax=Inquilinus sp. TaxID=1932117 RepID=UPI003F38DA9B
MVIDRAESERRSTPSECRMLRGPTGLSTVGFAEMRIALPPSYALRLNVCRAALLSEGGLELTKIIGNG